MTENPATGVWSVDSGGTADDWNGKYYQYAVEVYHPWGEGALNSTRAALKWSNLARDQRAEPFEVCAKPLGDSPDALCDLIGNVYEWVMLPRERSPAPSDTSQQTKQQQKEEQEEKTTTTTTRSKSPK